MEYEKAKKVYRWLWLSPLLTVPTFALTVFWDPGYEYYCCNWAIQQQITGMIAVLGSALWHLVLLGAVRNKESSFIRWHGRQALALAGLRTAVPLFFALQFRMNLTTFCFIPILVVIWLLGNMRGQAQAKRGDCALARWFGHADELPGLPVNDLEQTHKKTIKEEEIEELVRILRYSINRNFRANALQRLKQLGVVEDL